jgi:hypothetical protein
MNYKDKVKKALELIEGQSSDKWEFKFVVPALKVKEAYEVEVLPEHLHIEYEPNLKVELVNKYQATKFKITAFSHLYITHDEFIPVLDYWDVTESSEAMDVIGFPHIKTLQQFEDLYKALTGKELGDE